MNEDATTLDRNFLYNGMLARALVQLFPQEDRSNIHIWLEKLQSIDGDEETLMVRNSYMWLLLLTMQSGTLTEPFDRLPPARELPPISDIMPLQVYQEMLSSSEQNFSWIDRVISETNMVDENGVRTTGMAPHQFLEHQPQPINGISCYFSAFSKQS